MHAVEHFVIRLWPHAAGTQGGFNGTARHVRSGTEEPFVNEQQLLDFMRRMADAAAAMPTAEVEIAEADGAL